MKEVMLFGRFPADESKCIQLIVDDPDGGDEEEEEIQVANTAALRREIAQIKKGSVI
jgi:hypothetical protein